MDTVAAVAIGGAIGSLARHGINVAVASSIGSATPYATAVVNLVGSLVVGVLSGLLASGRLTMAPTVRTLVFVGLLGGFTTFSSFMLDTLTLAHTGTRTLALGNVAGQTVFGIAAVFLGYQVSIR